MADLPSWAAVPQLPNPANQRDLEAMMDRWLWAHLRCLSPEELAWLSSPEVVVEQSSRHYAPSNNMAFHWVWKRSVDGHVFGRLDLLPGTTASHIWLDDGTEEMYSIRSSNVTIMWKQTIERQKEKNKKT